MVLGAASRFLFFTGKGGVGKTSLACATALTLADRGARVLLVSTDPASNLSEVLGTRLGNVPGPVPGAPGLLALDIDPMAAAAAYRDRVVGPYRGVLPDQVVQGIEEQLSGSCTVEIAAFDQFTALLAAPGEFDHVVFDTAPTGHTLRMLALPGAWTSYLDTNDVGVTCVGPLSGLTQQRERYRTALKILADPEQTTLV
ncbi:MAG: TRC40/GET3/ArsA family transport-energizing ATPase, partial [Candidatus Dormibacteraeota bacterium]|nr:TRC40/GET3/ArsA family transport-energizing ATPase [Candidatus Dormibacteraeota bacterium]